ncbi:DUF7426 family protein [Actinomadura rubrisoli]|uniref:DUF7426 domain-containing protein n=1 Tax=Actinomadura rubrisoli TaxID=2530368 RepID=A0A4R5BVR4_9ACTN|nr:hypothetical protein [Actinomadura rubrisoli]TDD88352.1 hypothetical protein E1298_15190 [Actinomadura rubrisoli]
MTFKDLREFSEGAHIDLPIGGITYRINGVDAETGLLIQRLMDAGIKAGQSGQPMDLDEDLLDDAQELSTYESVLGDAYQQMLDDGVDWEELKRASMTTMIWIYFDEETAERFWETGAAGEAVAPATGQPPAGANRNTRRASSAAVRKTRSRASTSGTRASRSTTRTKAPGSRGKTSGSSGA